MTTIIPTSATWSRLALAGIDLDTPALKGENRGHSYKND